MGASAGNFPLVPAALSGKIVFGRTKVPLFYQPDNY
jgi:hypothetical protein